MEYIERVLKETLRLFPPLPMLVRYAKERIQLCEQIWFGYDFIIIYSNSQSSNNSNFFFVAKIQVPKGSTVLFTNWAAHRDPEVWPEPLKFDPDRFLPEESAKRQPGSFVPFGFGIRGCIG